MIGEDTAKWAAQVKIQKCIDCALKKRAELEAKIQADIEELDEKFELSKKVYGERYREEIERMHFEHRCALKQAGAEVLQNIDDQIAEFMSENGMCA